MKSETLDALLIDRSLGELTPEAEELLREHLGHDPAAARRGDELAALLGQARQAVAFDRAARPPPAPHLAQRDGWSRRFPALLPEVLKLAACVILGLAAGWSLHRWRAAAEGEPAVATVARLVDAGPARSAAEGGAAPAFWSVAYLETHQRERPAARPGGGEGDRIPWETFVK